MCVCVLVCAAEHLSSEQTAASSHVVVTWLITGGSSSLSGVYKNLKVLLTQQVEFRVAYATENTDATGRRGIKE